MSRKNQLPFPLNESSTSSRAIEEKALHDIRGAADHGLGAALILRDELVRIRSEHEQLQSTAMHSISYIRGTQKDLEVMDKKINDLQQSERETEKSFGDLTRKASTKTNLLLNDDCSIIFSFDNLTSAFSPIFKTADFGYPFVVRVGTTVNPNNQSESYLSIFISLLRGDYDPILAYPFKHNISFRLIDQSNQGKDLVSRLEVNPCSASFARPISEKNEEARIVNFCPLAQLTDPNSIYMKDGVYFVGVFIDFLASVP